MDDPATIDLPALRVFLAVAEARSFTRGAARLRLDRSRVSRVVRGLEGALGAPLFARTTRTVRLTPEGEALFAELAPVVAALERVLGATPARAAVPAGEVAITTTPDLGRDLLAPALVSFRAHYPAVRVTVVLVAAVVDLLGGGIDLALRVGKPGGGDLIARRLGSLEAGFFAAPAYLERRGTPRALPELATHERLWPAPSRDQRAFAPRVAPPPAGVQCADFGLLAELARLGGGIALLPTSHAARDVATGALVRVLPEVALGGAPLYLVARPGRPLPARVAALRDHLTRALRASLPAVAR
ncbi:MAG: LysR family transcriptional regulator [Kofleriaceae bacterium]|nr:LysR family transcriptional regulator [Kofleriaceae bacterium]MCL4228078.1 LysR family transcriptional regulator [Myxococcales bacterium]